MELALPPVSQVDKMRFFRLSALTINQTLVISHIVLVLILILGMSISRFNYEWQLHLKQASQRAEDVLLYHVKDFSILVAGRNYSNLMLPTKVEALYAHQNLLFLDIKGVSDHQSKLVHVRYLRKNKRVWREDISPQDIEGNRVIKERFEKLLQQAPAGDAETRAKLEYIINKATIDYKEGVESLEASQQFSSQIIEPSNSGNVYYFDAQLKQLHMSVPLRNNKDGRLWGVFDVRELASIHEKLLADIVFEALLAVFISLILIVIVTRRLVAPIKNLSKHMREEVENIKIREIKERYRRDEIGELARTFILLVTEIQFQVRDLKLKSNTDALTGLGSRHKYVYQAEPLLKTTLLSERNFALIICDIDNFKYFNDNYGHTEGDHVIQAVANAILNTISSNDKCYRIGGDEFVILIPDYIKGEHVTKAESIRQAVEQLNIVFNESLVQHNLSISLGMSFIEAITPPTENMDFSSLFSEFFNKADQQLYVAKNRGRNNVSSAKFILRSSK